MIPRLPRFPGFRIFDSFVAANEAILRIFLPGLPGSRRRESRPRGRAFGALSHLIRLFRSSVGSPEELVSILNALNDNRATIQRTIIVWLDLIEVLVQETERRHGQQPGHGRIKTAKVKQAVRYFLQSGRFSIANVPQPLATLLVDSVVEWAIDLIVLQANRYDLWEVDRQPPTALQRIWTPVRRALAAAVVGVANLFARLILALRRIFQPRPAISPALRAALEAVEREGTIMREGNLVVGVSRLVIWIGTHRADLVNAAELVFAAVQEAETLLTLSGREKKELARDLIWQVLEEMDFAPRSGILSAFIDSVIDLLIETAVHFFNKRGAFDHSS